MATPTTNYGFQKPEDGGDNNTWGLFLNSNWDAVDAQLKATNETVAALLGVIYPVGSLYTSTVDTNPAAALGGTWVAFGEGRVTVGVGTADGLAWAAEQERGEADVTLTWGEMPDHTHDAWPLTTSDTGNHTHTVDPASATTSSHGGHTHGVGSYKAAQGGNHNHRVTQGFISVNEANDGIVVDVLRVADGSQGTTTTESGTHAHVLTGTSSSGGSHTHTIDLPSTTTAAKGTHRHTVSGSVDNAGGGNSHTNVQPSIGVYMWKRTA